MKSIPGRALCVIAILCLVTCAGAARAQVQATPPQSPQPLLSTQKSLTNISSMPEPAIGEESTELSSGVFSYSKTDLSLPGPMPINVTRSVLNCSDSYTGPPSICNFQPSGLWFGSEIDANNNLTRLDGTVHHSDPTTGLLLGITDRFNNSITITRGPLAESSACHGSPTARAYNFTTMPGGAALAGSYTASGRTTTWLPLLDADGSTLGLVNAANPDSGPVTNYTTYDPSGNPTWSGTSNDWPFQYQGMEKEYTDPGTYYYSGGGQFYSPQLVRSLYETSATSPSSTGSAPAGNSIDTQSGGGGPDVGRNAGIATATGAPFGGLAVLLILWGSDKLTADLARPAAVVGTILDGLVQLFLDLFGNSSSPPTQRQLLHAHHPLYPIISGVPTN